MPSCIRRNNLPVVTGKPLDIGAHLGDTKRLHAVVFSPPSGIGATNCSGLESVRNARRGIHFGTPGDCADLFHQAGADYRGQRTLVEEFTTTIG